MLCSSSLSRLSAMMKRLLAADLEIPNASAREMSETVHHGQPENQTILEVLAPGSPRWMLIRAGPTAIAATPWNRLPPLHVEMRLVRYETWPTARLDDRAWQTRERP